MRSVIHNPASHLQDRFVGMVCHYSELTPDERRNSQQFKIFAAEEMQLRFLLLLIFGIILESMVQED